MMAKKTEVQDKVNEWKAWYQSKTIIGVIIAALGVVLKIFWPDVDLDGAVGEVMDSSDEIATAADDIWFNLTTGFGLILAFWGRLKAKMPIGKPVEPATP